MTDRLALPRRYRDELEALLREHVPGVEVWAYGSRVNGESHDGSDLDLALRGPALEPLDGGFNDLLEAIEKSTIPILVQAHDWARLPESFHREIERDCVVVQEGAKQTAANSWREVALGDVAEIVMGQSPPGDKVSGDNGLALLNGPTEFGASHPTPVQFTIDARKYAQPGDILFCVRGSTTGRMNWADQEYAIGRGVAAIRHKNDSALQPFVRGVIELGLSELLAQATGSTFPNVSAQQLAEIPYPSLDEDEQRAIAHILGTLDDKIELNRRMNQTLEAMARAIFQDWFMDFGPVRAKIQGLDPYLPSELWNLFPDELVDSDLGKIPEGWEVKALEQIIHLNPREPLKKGSVAPYLDMAALPTTGSIPETPVPRAFTSGARFRNGDTLLARITPCLENGKTAFVQSLPEGIAGWGSTEFIVMRPISPVPQQLTYFLARDCNFRAHAIQSMTGTSGRQRVQAEALASYSLPCPPPDNWAIFGSVVEELFARVKSNTEEITTLTAQRNTLLPKLVSGEVGVGELQTT